MSSILKIVKDGEIEINHNGEAIVLPFAVVIAAANDISDHCRVECKRQSVFFEKKESEANDDPDLSLKGPEIYRG